MDPTSRCAVESARLSGKEHHFFLALGGFKVNDKGILGTFVARYFKHPEGGALAALRMPS